MVVTVVSFAVTMTTFTLTMLDVKAVLEAAARVAADVRTRISRGSVRTSRMSARSGHTAASCGL